MKRRKRPATIDPQDPAGLDASVEAARAAEAAELLDVGAAAEVLPAAPVVTEFYRRNVARTIQGVGGILSRLAEMADRDVSSAIYDVSADQSTDLADTLIGWAGGRWAKAFAIGGLLALVVDKTLSVKRSKPPATIVRSRPVGGIGDPAPEP